MTDPTTPTPPATEGQAGSGEASTWTDDMRALLGKQVRIVLQREPTEVVVSGELVTFDEEGQVAVRDETGCVTWAWPNLEAAAQPPAPAPDTAEVLAGLRESMSRAVNRSEAIALVEAAQARLADPVRGGGSNG